MLKKKSWKKQRSEIFSICTFNLIFINFLFQESTDASIEVHQCPVCEKTFRISKIMFEHLLVKHKTEKQWKISDMLNIIEAKEFLYSSDSDCD